MEKPGRAARGIGKHPAGDLRLVAGALRRAPVLCLTLLGCAGREPATHQPAQGSAPTQTVQPTPGDLGAETESAAKLGAAIFAQDDASARATDAMLAMVHGKPDSRMHGWIAVEEGAGFHVLFLGVIGGKPMALYDVMVSGKQPPQAKALDPPAPLGAEFAARERALAAVNPPPDPQLLLCSERYNSIVLPASLVGKQGWLVYLLAASTKPGVVVVGGHHRFLVSPDGARIVEHLPLSKSCLNLPQRPPPGGEAVGIFVSHIVTAAPIETHVFLSLLHRMPLFVATSRGNWMVDGAKISFMGAR